MTRDELKLRLQRLFENTTYYAQTDFNASIQDGYDEVVAFSGCILKSATIAFTSQCSYYDMIALIPDYVGAVAIFNTVTKWWLTPTSVKKLDMERDDWETAIGTPEFFAPISHRYIALYKKPLVVGYGNMLVFYRAAAPTLGASDEILIPDEFIASLEDYNITDLWEQGEEWTKAGNHLEDYADSLKQLHKWVHSERIPDRAPFLRG